MFKNENNESEKLGFLNLLVLILSIYVLGVLLVDTLFILPKEISKVLGIVDNFLCGIFFLEFIVQFKNAKNKLQFMKWGWIDLVSSIPTLDLFRTGRTLRLLRLLRILRAFRSTKRLIHHLFRNRTQGTFSTALIIAILMVIFSSIAILQVENDVNSNIKSAEDAIWWSFVTITTVGYGDKFPVTTEGRIIAAFLMTIGVGLFGTYTGFVATWFIGQNKKNTFNDE